MNATLRLGVTPCPVCGAGQLDHQVMDVDVPVFPVPYFGGELPRSTPRPTVVFACNCCEYVVEANQQLEYNAQRRRSA